MKIMRTSCGFLLAALVMGATADQVKYDDMYISYCSANHARAMGQYVAGKKPDSTKSGSQKLGGMIMWELRGDAPYTGVSDSDKTSLLGQFDQGMGSYELPNKKPPMVMGYWDDWGVYTNDPSTRAIPEPAYPMPGSVDGSGTAVSGAQVQDLQEKLSGVNVVTYAFLEAQSDNYSYYDNASKSEQTIANKTPGDIGTLYFNDAWADLVPPSKADTEQKAFCSTATGAKVCWFGLQNRTIPIAPEAGSMMGNFDAFAKVSRDTKTPVPSTLGPLRRVVSIGGYGHDATFEAAFAQDKKYNTDKYVMNFVNSTVALVNAFNLDGVDLDYENPQMTQDQSKDYADLIAKLRKAMPNKLITIAILAAPDYIDGSRSGLDASGNKTPEGFAKGVLQNIAKNVNYIDLMTYDFHGAFDYVNSGETQGSHGRTGYLTNIYKPTDSKPTENYKFNVDESVSTLIGQGVPAEQVVIGIPAYGRSLVGISSVQGGVFQSLLGASLPKGDLDLKNCDTAIYPLGPNTCGGMFNYDYILKHMLGQGFTQTEHEDGEVTVVNAKGNIKVVHVKGVNATTAFADHWSVPAPSGYSLEIASSSSNSISFNVHVGAFTAPDFFNKGDDKTYGPVQTSAISGQQGLVVSWTTSWGPKGQCPDALNFTANKKVVISVTPVGTGVYKTDCTIS